MDLRRLASSLLPGPVPRPSRIYNLTGSSAALLLALREAPFVAVEADEAKAETLCRDINFFRLLTGLRPVSFLPDAGGSEAAGERARIILSLEAGDSLVTSSANLSVAFWSGETAELPVLELRKGGSLGRDGLEEALLGLGYVQATMVAAKGQYSRREWIMDVFPSTAEDPVRIEFFGDEVESLRSFDLETQRSRDDLDAVRIFAAAETGGESPLADLVTGREWHCLYAPDERTGLPPDTVFLSKYSFVEQGAEGCDDEEGGRLEQIEATPRSLKGAGILPDERHGIEGMPGAVKLLSGAGRVVVVAASGGQAERLRELFRGADMIVPRMEAHEVAAAQERVVITTGALSAGLSLEGLVFLTQRELFGERTAMRPMKRSKVGALLSSLDDIAVGDFVVHRDHGIGRFTGAVRRHPDGGEVELMTIEYEDGRLYIPVQNIRVISKFRAEEGYVPGVDRIGGKTWQKKKDRAKKKIHDMAERLLRLYAGRKEARGFTFSPDTELHREFDGFFPYEETPDQLRAIADIKRDMESERPMERLLCGDVGYGKTEVAMRAAFKAVYDHRQVAVLVPTTILAEQHYRTFRERFSGFPVAIDFISRFKTAKENTAALKALAAGSVDIIIGTHALLAKRVVFNRLGLLIVDEEHRFGVGQKERVKELSRNIDVLTLTATPIPRTLHMALSGIRDMSVIETPPEERLSVRSLVSTFNDALIRDAVARELDRGGQVYFVHNRVHDIHKVAHKVQELAPAASLGVAHGQMPERELEAVMHRFFHGDINLLVSTAIVGAGLDIPRANTIVIDMADRMGLADLYQLRGRVGRSTVKGYAFFLAPPESVLSESAKRRLQAVQEMSYLGAGFRLALKDLEIRGAGDIFGAEQSGHVHEIGFDLYMEMLEQAVSELKGEVVPQEFETAIELRTVALIPDSYVEDTTLRLGFYRRIAALASEEEILSFASELRDRFGGLPREVLNLLDIVRLKLLCRVLLVTKIKEARGRVQVTFSAGTPVQPAHILALGKKGRRAGVRILPEGFEAAAAEEGGSLPVVLELLRDMELRVRQQAGLPETAAQEQSAR